MPIASYQKKVFQVSSSRKYSFDGLSWAGELDTEAQEKVKDKPSTYIKGRGLNTMNFEIPLRAEFGLNVRAEIEQWEAIRDKAIPDFFILGSKPVSKNKWLLKSVSVDNTEIDGRGQIRKATIKLELEEYVRAGKAQPKESSGGGGTGGAPGVARGSNMVPESYLKPKNKAQNKHKNPNVQAALERSSRMDKMYGEGV